VGGGRGGGISKLTHRHQRILSRVELKLIFIPVRYMPGNCEEFVTKIDLGIQQWAMYSAASDNWL